MVSLLQLPQLCPSHLPYDQDSTMDAHAEHNYPLALQEYMDLQSQRELLCSNIEHLRPPSLSTSTSNASTISSPSTSPTRYSSRRHRSAERRTASRMPARCSGFEDSDAMDTIPDEETMYEISLEEQRLVQVDESIKRALTELLNCSTVRRDGTMRIWVQSRLMETEKVLRSGRRRRSSD